MTETFGDYLRENDIKDIRNVNSFLDVVNELNERYKNKLYFRGHARSSWQLESGLSRSYNNIRKKVNIRMWDYEKYLLNESIRQRPNVFQDAQDINLLPLMQHYGLPTRLLDFTENPLIALYFACSSSQRSDGRVYFVLSEESESTYDRIVIDQICSLWRYDCYDNLTCTGILSDSQYEKWIHKNPKGLGGYAESINFKLLFLRPSYISNREIIQKSALLVIPNKCDLIVKNNKIQISQLRQEEFYDSNVEDIVPQDELMEFGEKVETRISSVVIPYTMKEKILKQLFNLGISEADLFPDNIEKLTKQVSDIGFLYRQDIK